MNTTRPERSADEGIVAQVDGLRKLCKVKTLSGQNLNMVRWTESSGGSGRGGDRSTPSIGDCVYLDYRLGYPVITGFLPKVQSSDNAFPLVIDSGAIEADTGNFSAGGQTTWADQNKPRDMLNGDRLIGSDGGVFMAVLRFGTAMIKASPLAQIIVSKIDDVVKIVSRNFEHYTDASSDVIRNVGGRVYRYIGYTNNFANSKTENYQYQLYYGDAVLAEALKSDNLSTSSAAGSDVIFKEQMKSGGNVIERSVALGGSETVSISGGGTTTTRTSTSSALVLNFNGQNTITVQGADVTIRRADGSVITLTADGIEMTYTSGKVKMHSAGVDTTFGSHYVKVNNGGVQLG